MWIFQRLRKDGFEAAYLADPGEARGCSTNSFVIDSVTAPFPPTALWRSHAQTVRDRSSSNKIDYVICDQELSKSRRAS